MENDNNQTKLDRRSKRVEIAKNCFEIIAIFIGGLWALYIFFLKDAPNLNKSFKVTSYLKIDKIINNNVKSQKNTVAKCDVDCSINVKNIGYLNLYIDSIVTIVWQLPLDSVSIDSYLNLNKLDGENKPTYSNLIHPGSPLIGYYPPETESNEDFDFVLPIDTNKSVIVEYHIWGHGKSGFFKTEKIDLNGYAWEVQCVPEKDDSKDEKK